MDKRTKTNSQNLLVLYEDNHIIVINKRPGDIVQGDKTGDIPLSEIVKQYIKKKHNKPGKVFLGVVHRIDRPTSGIVIFARTSKALSRLNELFSKKEAKKTYWAIVKNQPENEQGTLEHWMVRNTRQNKSYAHIKEVPNSKKAILDYKTLKKLNNYYLLEINLKTGRHHQIRAQLAAIKCPIKGDLKYGFDRSNKNGSIHLHARSIEFLHPVKKETIKILAPTFEDAVWDACS
ncbi:RluA family pseudouridine synthase [Eudoraea adriatica]|uniref:RluA family pseudouridine synthase n=1 Tax=Eudoraea adriatica TaxID=446681 RepID=UPI000364CC64|nr:RNA pseudouridine synthase [Eudoraea adriatica]